MLPCRSCTSMLLPRCLYLRDAHVNLELSSALVVAVALGQACPQLPVVHGTSHLRVERSLAAFETGHILWPLDRRALVVGSLVHTLLRLF